VTAAQPGTPPSAVQAHRRFVVLTARIDCEPLEEKRSPFSSRIVLQLFKKILMAEQRRSGLARLKIFRHETLLLSH
jgi:hypothetical protein